MSYMLEPAADGPGTVPARFQKLEDKLDITVRELDARLLQIEGKAAEPVTKKPKVPWQGLLSAAQILAMPVVIVLVGFGLTGKLDLAIKQQQADLAGVTGMQESLKTLYADGLADGDYFRAALFVGAFGGVAAGPLVQAYDLGGDGRELAAERGLIAAGVRDVVRVCEVLKVVAGSKGEIYRPETRTLAAKISGGLSCGSGG